MTRTWIDNAVEFAALSKQGKDVRLALLVACSVEKGKGEGGNPKTRSHRNERDGEKVSAQTFAKRAGTSAPRILRHLDAWNAAAGSRLVSDQLTPDQTTTLSVSEAFVARFEKAYQPVDGGRPRDGKAQDAVAIIAKQGVSAVVDEMPPEMKDELLGAIERSRPAPKIPYVEEPPEQAPGVRMRSEMVLLDDHVGKLAEIVLEGGMTRDDRGELDEWVTEHVASTQALIGSRPQLRAVAER